MNTKNIYMLVVMLMFFFSLSCDKTKENDIFNPDSTDYIEPAVTSIDLDDKQIIDSRTVTISWKGNKTASEYKYSLNDSISSWSADTSVTFVDLDEKLYSFSIVARNKNGYEGDAVKRTFIVKLDEPVIWGFSLSDGLVFPTRTVKVSWTGNFYAKKYHYLLDGHIEAVTDTTCVEFTDLDEGLHTFVLTPANDRGELFPDAAQSATFTVKLETPLIKTITLRDNWYIQSRTLSISWTGNYTAIDYQYSLDDASYVTLTDSTVTFENLIDGKHTFKLLARNDRGEQGKVLSKTFIVDLFSVELTFSKKKLAINETEFDLLLQNLSGIDSAHIEMAADDNCVSFSGFTVDNAMAVQHEYDVVTSLNGDSRLVIDIAFHMKDMSEPGPIRIGQVNVHVIRDGYVKADSLKTHFISDYDESISFENANTVQIDYSWSINGLQFVTLPGRTFEMGSRHSGSDEWPYHDVTLSTFEISIYEMTQDSYSMLTGTNSSYFSGEGTLPVEQVTWWDAIKVCNRLSERAGLPLCYNEITGECDIRKNGFRLPTEAEWEYACKGRITNNEFTSDMSWNSSNSGNRTHPVGERKANRFGLYDILGNVWEWCNDWYGPYESASVNDPAGPLNGNYRVLRGGYYGLLSSCSPTNRYYYEPDAMDNSIGFRVVRRP